MADAEDVRKLAALARLSIDDAALGARAAEFDTIVGYIKQLDELSIPQGGAPEAPALRNVTREDSEPTPRGTWTKKLVAQFPERAGNHLSVKKIISHD